jgi:hypothetical protein
LLNVLLFGDQRGTCWIISRHAAAQSWHALAQAAMC